MLSISLSRFSAHQAPSIYNYSFNPNRNPCLLLASSTVHFPFFPSSFLFPFFPFSLPASGTVYLLFFPRPATVLLSFFLLFFFLLRPSAAVWYCSAFRSSHAAERANLPILFISACKLERRWSAHGHMQQPTQRCTTASVRLTCEPMFR